MCNFWSLFSNTISSNETANFNEKGTRKKNWFKISWKVSLRKNLTRFLRSQKKFINTHLNHMSPKNFDHFLAAQILTSHPVLTHQHLIYPLHANSQWSSQQPRGLPAFRFYSSEDPLNDERSLLCMNLINHYINCHLLIKSPMKSTNWLRTFLSWTTEI